VQHGDLFSLGHSGDQQVGEADRPDLPAAPERGLDIERAPPVRSTTMLSGAGAVVEVGGEGGVAASAYFPAQRRVG
jgi:hypothetical protein